MEEKDHDKVFWSLVLINIYNLFIIVEIQV
jgi:hypothetical protein